MVTHIASHLPAHCVITVLPKVCHALRNVGKDNTAWQLRARRLIGPKASFPVGPREDFDWPFACLEIERLITCWTNVTQVGTKEHQDDADSEGVEQQRRDWPNGEPVAADNRAGAMEPEQVEVQGGAYAVEEGVVFEEMGGEPHPVVVEDQLRGVLEERLEDNPEQMMQEDGHHPVVFEGQDHDPDHQQDLAHLGFRGNGGHVEIEHQAPSSLCPPPALECITLLSGHIAEVNSVLLVGGDGAVCATGSRDRDVKLWNLRADSSNMLMHTLVGQGHFNTHQGWVWCLASQGPLLASGGFDRTVRLWDLQACGAERGVIRTEAAVICLSCLPDVLLAGTFNEKVQMYDPRAAVPLVKTLRHHSNSVLCLAADDKYIISASKDSTVVVHDRRADKSLYKVRLRSYLRSMSYSDREIWGGDIRGMLCCFSMQEGVLNHLSQFDVGHTAMVTGIYKSPGRLYTCSSDFTVKVHIPCGPPKTLCTLRHQDGVSGLSVEAEILAVTSGDMCVEIWRPRKSEM
ncbi:F-box/WD repeat-containing protein 9 [Hippocampus zosterae]|uniref:F-box/WD repeat-containing protein 9 n=1 Tax=Hippocampus zosterae TaxID=109293 RepID=UPI00223E4E1A|nr:F-box/WD repeat-containing protein 9 [Hippocampus zosterae]